MREAKTRIPDFVYALFSDVYEELMSLDYVGRLLPDRVDIELKPIRSTKVWGTCNVHHDSIGQVTVTIELNIKLFKCEAKGYYPLRSVMVHELLHSCTPTSGHHGEWKRLADIVTASSEYHVKTRDNFKAYGLEISITKTDDKLYIVQCQECGNKYRKQRICSLIRYTSNYRCGRCKGKLKLVSWPNGVLMARNV